MAIAKRNMSRPVGFKQGKYNSLITKLSFGFVFGARAYVGLKSQRLG
jgi:hypothetical protein